MAVPALCSNQPLSKKLNGLSLGWVLPLAACWVLVGCAPEDADGQSAIRDYAEAAPVLARKCVRCHAEPPANGAPFALETYEQVYARRVDVERVLVQGIMPLQNPSVEPPVEDLTPDERADLVRWLQAGAPR